MTGVGPSIYRDIYIGWWFGEDRELSIDQYSWRACEVYTHLFIVSEKAIIVAFNFKGIMLWQINELLRDLVRPIQLLIQASLPCPPKIRTYRSWVCDWIYPSSYRNCVPHFLISHGYAGARSKWVSESRWLQCRLHRQGVPRRLGALAAFLQSP